RKQQIRTQKRTFVFPPFVVHLKKSLRNTMATYSEPPSSPEITKLVNKLVQRFICIEITNHDQSREQSLARQRNEMLQYCMRILGSRISPTIVPDDYNVSQLIQKKCKS